MKEFPRDVFWLPIATVTLDSKHTENLSNIW